MNSPSKDDYFNIIDKILKKNQKRKPKPKEVRLNKKGRGKQLKLSKWTKSWTRVFEGHLWGNSIRYSPNQVIDDYYDLFIFTAGWEEHCTKIIEVDSHDFKFNKCILLSFLIDGKKGWVDEYLNRIKNFIKKDKKSKNTINCTVEGINPIQTARLYRSFITTYT